jgi:hypothetical protein
VYDIIGDIHGYAQALEKMLVKLGYELTGKGYVHPTRKAVFVGDFVDRGPEIIRSLEIVKQMVDNGAAYAIVGNHEYNVICYYTKDKEGNPLRERNLKNRTQIKRTQEEFNGNKEQKKKYLKWLRNLPVYLELDGLRVVHACWDSDAVELLKKTNPENRLSKKFLRRIVREEGADYHALMLLMKGREFNLPDDMVIKDSYGFRRSSFRIKWWAPMDGASFQNLAFGNKFKLPAYTIPKEMCYPIPPYDEKELPVFFGHYCLNGQAGVVKNNLCCVDACVANGGRLAAYRWDGEKVLDAAKMVFELEK